MRREALHWVGIVDNDPIHRMLQKRKFRSTLLNVWEAEGLGAVKQVFEHQGQTLFVLMDLEMKDKEKGDDVVREIKKEAEEKNVPGNQLPLIIGNSSSPDIARRRFSDVGVEYFFDKEVLRDRPKSLLEIAEACLEENGSREDIERALSAAGAELLSSRSLGDASQGDSESPNKKQKMTDLAEEVTP